MAGRVRRVTGGGTWVLDCEALSRLLLEHPLAVADLDTARRMGTAVAVSAMTIPEAYQGRVSRRRLSYVLSRIRVETVTEQIAVRASELLHFHGLHGHKYAIDAVVAATAQQCPGPVALLTSDVEDLTRLCHLPDLTKDEQVRIIPV